MRALLSVLAVIAAALAVVAAALAGHDRQTLVSPPDAVAEGFTRQVAARRYESAPRYLSTELRRTVGGAELRAWFDPVRQRLGSPNTVDATVEWVADDRASARASVDAALGTAVLQLPMIQERGLWVIAALPADVPIGITSQ